MTSKLWLSLYLLGLLILVFYKYSVSIPQSIKVKFDKRDRVVEVIDGDTIRLSNQDVVRYIGIDAPEVNNGNQAHCFSKESLLFNQKLVLNKEVDLYIDVSDVDKYGRKLRFVFVDGVFVNQKIIDEGASRLMIIPPDEKAGLWFFVSEMMAKVTKKGLWGICN